VRHAARVEQGTDVLDAHGAGQTAVRGSALRSASYVAGVSLSLLSVPLLIRHLGNAEWGVYVTITALVAIVSGVSDFGLTLVGVREWASTDDQRRRHDLMADLLGARLTFGLLGAGAAVVFALAAGYSSRQLAGTALAALAIVVIACQQALTVPLAGRLRQGWIAGADLLRQAVQVVLILALIAAGAGLVPLLAALIPAALAALVLTARVAPEGIVRPAMRPRAWLTLLRGMLPFAAASAVSVVYLRATMLLTALVASAAQTGWFGTAFRVMDVLLNVPSLLLGALFPLLARAAATDPERLRSGLDRTLQGALAMGALLAVTVVAGAPLIVQILTGHQPHQAVDALRVLGVGMGFSFIGATCQLGLLAVHAHRSILLLNLAALTCNVTLTLLLAGRHGAVGAAIALAVSEVLIALTSATLLHRSTGMRVTGATLARLGGVVLVGGTAAILASTAGDVTAALVTPAFALATAVAVRALPVDLFAMLLRRGGTA
jgi:O-antigen/teichoic acid export membrane protein